MGERLLAQRLIRLLRDTTGRTSRTGLALLDWAVDQRDWLWPGIAFADDAGAPPEGGWLSRFGGSGETLCWERLPALAEAIDTREAEPALFGCVDTVAELLVLDPFEREVLRVVAAFDRLPRLAAFRSRLFGSGEDLPALVGRLAGAEPGEAARRVRRSAPVALGLLFAGDGDYGAGGQDLGIDWRFGRVLDAGLTDPDRLIDALAGIRQSATLAPDDFADQREAFALLARLLAAALARGSAGVNVLLYGPPGTGKTELARTLAAEVGATLYAVGEEVEGEEPSRSDRLSALKRAERLLARRGGSLLLFDEMEDLFHEASLFAGQSTRRTSSKIFVNRLLEGNRVPTIWTSNAIDAIDPAHLRRMSYILRMGYPNPRARARIVARVAEAEGVAEAGSGLDRLLPEAESMAGVARAALRAAALTGGGAADAEAVGRSLVLGLRGGRALPPAPAGAVDLDLYEADPPVAELVGRIATPGAPTDVSLLLTGPPGTGKTALAACLAERFDRPLTVVRASDLLSPWVGETEAKIAQAFAEARERGAVLLFDEADSLLLDRADATRSWEVSRVNEMLTWMDLHPLPFVAATNFARRLDPATLRRFVFKIELKTLSPALAVRAFARFFSTQPPAGLARIAGLTPGDFAVVARQLRFGGGASPADILGLLEAEARAKPEPAGPIGF
ncbi:MAG: AAA family ATPase [Sphingosinicella sp.]|uniref:AAA family ATPase n=1 Tax=Sphingosinicella sp. TaxID=1917971 RepID=UPI004037963A